MSVALWHTARNNDWFILSLSFLYQGDEFLLRWILDGTRIKKASVCAFNAVNNLVAIISEEARHVFSITDIMRASHRLDVDALCSWSSGPLLSFRLFLYLSSSAPFQILPVRSLTLPSLTLASLTPTFSFSTTHATPHNIYVLFNLIFLF